jgi:hypothetical protein
MYTCQNINSAWPERKAVPKASTSGTLAVQRLLTESIDSAKEPRGVTEATSVYQIPVEHFVGSLALPRGAEGSTHEEGSGKVESFYQSPHLLDPSSSETLDPRYPEQDLSDRQSGGVHKIQDISNEPK